MKPLWIDIETSLRLDKLIQKASGEPSSYTSRQATIQHGKLIIPIIKVIEGQWREPIPLRQDEIDLFDMLDTIDGNYQANNEQQDN